MHRREFLKNMIWVWIWIIVPKIAFAEKEIIQTSEIVEDILDPKTIEKYEKSLVSIGKNEMDFFIQFFFSKINQEIFHGDIVKKIQELQAEFGFSQTNQDGILWPMTLKQIYLQKYFQDTEKLDIVRKNRVEIYTEMLKYSQKKWALSTKLDVFSQMTFFGRDVWPCREHTFINESLFWIISETIPKKINKIFISKYQDKHILSFYIDGNLQVATYVSIWKWRSTPRLRTKWQRSPSLLHISSEYPEIKDNNGNIIKKWWAVMPYAVHIDGSIRIHGSDGIIDGHPQSKWCIRAPLFYLKEIFEKVKELWISHVSFDTTWI